MRKIKCGIVGVGFIGPHHIEAVRRLGYVEVLALAGSNLERAKAKADKYNVPKAYGNYQDLINDPEIEVVHNTTPNHLHLPVNLAAARARKHIISDKPLGMNASEARQMLDAARQNRIVHAVCFNYRYNAMVQQARQMILSGDLGPVYFVHGDYLQDWLLYDTDYNWRLEPNQGGPARALADIGSHWCDLAQYVTGLKIERVLADFSIIYPERKKPAAAVETFAGKGKTFDKYEIYKVTTEDVATVLVRFSNGRSGVFTVSQVSAGHKNHLRLEVDCAKASLFWDQERAHELAIGYRDKANEVLLKDPSLMSEMARPYAALPGGHNEAWPDALKNLIANVYRFIAEGCDMERDADKVDFPTFVDGYVANAIVDAAIESFRQGGRWTEVALAELKASGAR